jgi:hypothetical protein
VASVRTDWEEDEVTTSEVVVHPPERRALIHDADEVGGHGRAAGGKP